MTDIIGETTFVVPDGYQALIRDVELIPGEVLVNSSANGLVPIEMLMSFYIDGGGVTENTKQSIRLLDGSNIYPLFFPVPSRANIRVVLEMDQSVFTVIGTGFDTTIILHGNLLLDDDRPTNFMVSTKRG